MENSERDDSSRLPYLPLRNLYVGQEEIEPDMKQWTGSKLGKEYIKAESQPRLLGEISTTSDTHMISLEWQKVKRN